MDYLTALGNGMSPSTPLNECEINVSVNFKPDHLPPPPSGDCWGFTHSSCPWGQVFALVLPVGLPGVYSEGLKSK